MKKNISIKEPCSENWEQMTSTQKGAFCNNCAMDVYDFSNKSGDEIRDILKLNLGGLCGRLKSSQLADLNSDFTAWNLNSKRSFQSALIFSLIVAFGMTLFGCEEDENVQIKEIQSVGMTFIDDSEVVVDSIQQETIELQNTVASNINSKPEDIIEVVPPEEFIMGEFLEQEYPDSITDVPLTRIVNLEPAVLGGIGFSSEFITYLEDIPDLSNGDDERIEFQTFTFPNPAKEHTTLKIILPEETKVQVKLFDIGGQFIRNINANELPKGESNLPIDLIDLPSGVYIISIITSETYDSVNFIKE